MSAGQCLIPLVAAGTLLMSAGVQAQEAASIKVGETQLTPAVRLDYLSIDNLYRKGINPVSGSAVLVKPELVWRADRRLLTLDAMYSGEYGTFSEDGLDYDNHNFRLRGYANLSSKQRLSTSLSFLKRVEEQGTGQADTLLIAQDEQIEISGITAQAEYGYGALDALGNLRGGLSVGSVSYANLAEITNGDDYSFIEPYGIFSLRLSPDTRILAEVRFATYDFDDNRRDRSQVSLLTGLELSATSKLSGDARIGVTKATFDQNNNDDTTALIAEVGLVYSPVSYSQFRIDFDRDLQTVDQSSNNAGRYVFDDATIAWTHAWSSRFQTLATFNLTNTDRECPGIDGQTMGVGLELNLQVRRWLQFGISGAQTNRTVTSCDGTTAGLEALEYDRSVVGAHIRATL